MVFSAHGPVQIAHYSSGMSVSREYAHRHELHLLDEHVYTDEAITGATEDRAWLRRFLEAARQKPRPFDVILVDDTSRLSRDLAHSLEIVKRMKFAGIGVVFVSQGFDTNTPQTQTLVTVHGLVDSLYLEELAKKTFRGVEQRAIHGLHTGGRYLATLVFRLKAKRSEIVTAEPLSTV